MGYPVAPLIEKVHFPPISEVKAWVASRRNNDMALIDLCQAVPDYAPAPGMTTHLASLLADPQLSRYSPDEGLAEVHGAICDYYRRKYGAVISPANLCMTIGASQAFWLAIVSLCCSGDEVIVQAPYYFDHAMALDMLGIRGIYAPFDETSGGVPSLAAIERLVTVRTRAIVIVTPSNPTGAITPPEMLAELFELARRHNIALILDETYNEFIPDGQRPHELFGRADWGEHFIHLASFGKTFALTGYRAGMLAASATFIHHALKALDAWVAANRTMMARRHDLFRSEFLQPGNPFQLAASGAFFAWVRHPFSGLTGRQAAKKLVDEAAILCLPGEVFGPGLEGYLRLAFGNIREEIIPEAARRFRAMEC